jgi:hypothetical protein
MFIIFQMKILLYVVMYFGAKDVHSLPKIKITHKSLGFIKCLESIKNDLRVPDDLLTGFYN